MEKEYNPRHLYIKQDGSLLVQCNKDHPFNYHFGQLVDISISNNRVRITGAVLKTTRTGIILIGWKIEHD